MEGGGLRRRELPERREGRRGRPPQRLRGRRGGCRSTGRERLRLFRRRPRPKRPPSESSGSVQEKPSPPRRPPERPTSPPRGRGAEGGSPFEALLCQGSFCRCRRRCSGSTRAGSRRSFARAIILSGERFRTIVAHHGGSHGVPEGDSSDVRKASRRGALKESLRFRERRQEREESPPRLLSRINRYRRLRFVTPRGVLSNRPTNESIPRIGGAQGLSRRFFPLRYRDMKRIAISSWFVHLLLGKACCMIE